MLDVEYNLYGPSCYGLTPTQMSSWIREFSTTVHARTRQYPAIYSTADWWNTCTARDGSFAATNPLCVANYSGSVATLPAGWEHQTIWQYADHGTYPGDADVFNGTLAQLHAFADALPAQQLSFDAPDPLAARYTQLGGAGSYLGNPVGAQYPITGGIGQNSKAGRMYYTPATGAHALRGAILAGYLTLGGPAGPVGVPTTDELASADSAGRYNHFTRIGRRLDLLDRHRSPRGQRCYPHPLGSPGLGTGPPGLPDQQRVPGHQRRAQRLPARVDHLDRGNRRSYDRVPVTGRQGTRALSTALGCSGQSRCSTHAATGPPSSRRWLAAYGSPWRTVHQPWATRAGPRGRTGSAINVG